MNKTKEKKSESPVKTLKLKLWTFNYRVIDYTELPVRDESFDLLVNDSIKVKVGTKEINKFPSGCDVYALVVGKQIRFFTKPLNGLVESSSPTQVFGKK